MATLINTLSRGTGEVALRRRKFLVMWSGGLDSTWTLYKLLTESDAEIYAHHVCKRSRSDDGTELSNALDYERQATRAMQQYLSEAVRPFSYSESFVDLTIFTTFARDMVTGVFFTTQAAMTWGFAPDDLIFMGSNGDEDKTNSDDPALLYRAGFNMMMYRGVMQAVMQADRTPEITWLMPAPTRAEEIEDLPKEIVALAACCRNPIKSEDGSFEACRKCVTCKSLGRHLKAYRAIG